MNRVVDGFLMGLHGGDVDAVLVTGGPDALWTGLDAQLETSWRIQHARPRPLFQRHFVEGGVVRRLGRGGVIEPLARIAMLDGGDDLARVLAVRDDGFVVARGQRIARVDRAGRLVWPEVRTLPGVPTKVCTSGDRMLVATDSLEYWAWGYLGPSCLLRLDDGALVGELRGDGIAAYGDDGQFLLTLEGYDVFDTWLHDGDGNLLQSWRTSGHLVPDPDGTARVLEKDRRSPTRSRVVRLHRDGAIERGPELRDAQCAAPVVLDDGRLVFVDRGCVRVVDRALGIRDCAELLTIEEREDYRYHARVARFGDRVIVSLCERLPEAQQPQGPGRTFGDMRHRCYLAAVSPSAA